MKTFIPAIFSIVLLSVLCHKAHGAEKALTNLESALETIVENHIETEIRKSIDFILERSATLWGLKKPAEPTVRMLRFDIDDELTKLKELFIKHKSLKAF